MKEYFITHNKCTHIIIIIIYINININFIHKINLKNNFIYTGCPTLNNALRFLKNYGRYEKMFQTKVI